MSYHNIVRFDWIGASGTRPHSKQILAPTVPDILAAQLAYVASKFEKPVIVVGQGGVEPVILTFAHRYPELVKACSISTGFSTAPVTRKVSPILKKIAYALLCSFVGCLFWNFASSQKFITSFSKKKNLFRTDEWTNEWVYRVKRAANDPTSRFLLSRVYPDTFLATSEKNSPKFVPRGSSSPVESILLRMITVWKDRKMIAPKQRHRKYFFFHFCA